MSVKRKYRDAIEALEGHLERRERPLLTVLEVLNDLRRADGLPPRRLGDISEEMHWAPTASPDTASVVSEDTKPEPS